MSPTEGSRHRPPSPSNSTAEPRAEGHALRDRPLLNSLTLAQRLLDQPAPVSLAATGADGCAAALVVRRLLDLGARSPLLVTASSQRGRLLRDDLAFVLGGSTGQRARVLLLDAPEHSPYAAVLPDRRRSHERLAARLQLALSRQALGAMATGGSGETPSRQRPLTPPAPSQPATAEHRAAGNEPPGAAGDEPHRAAGDESHRAAAEGPPTVVVVTARALLRQTAPLEQVLRAACELRAGDGIDRDGLVARLVAAGYLRVPMVEDPATLAVRGGLIDVWSAGHEGPLRVVLDGDRIASLERFDPLSQRRVATVEAAWLAPARVPLLDASTREAAVGRLRALCDAVDWPSSKTRHLIDELCAGHSMFRADAYAAALGELQPLHLQLTGLDAVLLDEPETIEQALSDAITQATVDWQATRDEPGCERSALFCEPTLIRRWLGVQPTVALSRLAVEGALPDAALGALAAVDEQTPSLAMESQHAAQHALASARTQHGGGSLDPLIERISAWQADGLRVCLSARSHAQADRLVEMLRSRELAVHLLPEPAVDPLLDTTIGRGGSAVVHVAVGALARGVVAPLERLVLMTEEEIFGQRAHRRARRSAGKAVGGRLLDDLRSLGVGDYVVHREHGIGRYQGLVHRQVHGHLVDMLAVDYAAGDRLYLPVYRLNQLGKYRGSSAAPKLNRLGGQGFARSRKRAHHKARQLADELLSLYAERHAAAGQATPPIDDDYRLFETGFAFEETQDQAQTISEVNADLQAPCPMDRLVCGDVGFGKTEVALRAAFRVAMSGRQVAVLCPTTVLAQQHELTFAARFAGYPIQLAVLSRFRSRREVTATIAGLRRGTVDVVVGTHRLLSKDVHFKHLGLLVIDEEQRFGVGAKERIKTLRKDVDVLTLSATPIPRTLQMAVSGLRDLSVMTSAPADRRAVRTIVTRRDHAVLREAIERELDRGGQVFFVYNRIEGLAERARLVQELAPHARIAIGHGQLAERQLERTMIGFVRGDFDILCTTAIIENGLDIPRANTIIIDRADMYGLAQLYQLRGRVGRSAERAYCYLVLPADGRLSDEAHRRLDALSRHSELGSGFQLAALDLDLRGGGNLLGPEQSGAVAAVGVELFCNMVEQAAAQLRGEPVVQDVDPELSFDVEALLPEGYISDVGLRLSSYKRLAAAADADAVSMIGSELEDRFGPAPPAARRLLQLMRVKTQLRRLRTLACEATAGAVTLHLREDAPLDVAKLTAMLAAAGPRYRLSPELRLSRRSDTGEQFRNGIEACQRLLVELEPCLIDG